MTARVRITADDAGCNPSIDQAIISLLSLGRITRAAAFSNGPCFSSFVRQTKDKFRVIPHLTLTYGCPMGDPANVRILLNEFGNFIQPLDFFRGNIDDAIDQWASLLTRLEDYSELDSELGAQLAHFERAYSHKGDELSFHHDIDKFLIDAVTVGASAILERGREGRKRARQDCGAEYTLIEENTGISDATGSVVQMMQGLIRLSERNGGLPVEAVFHPSVDCDGLGAFTAYRSQRVLEFQALQSKQFSEVIEGATPG
jgi:predicted glycoside hydrolase/deacetylase ChbG (UPF0249 family)